MSTSPAVSEVAAIKYEIVLDEIRGQLARRHMTQQGLARRADIRQSTLSRRMTGETPFTLPELFDVCAVLGMSVTELLMAADANRPRPGGAGAGRPVAGARFELATSGLPERVADVVRLHPELTRDDFELTA